MEEVRDEKVGKAGGKKRGGWKKRIGIIIGVVVIAVAVVIVVLIINNVEKQKSLERQEAALEAAVLRVKSLGFSCKEDGYEIPYSSNLGDICFKEIRDIYSYMGEHGGYSEIYDQGKRYVHGIPILDVLAVNIEEENTLEVTLYIKIQDIFDIINGQWKNNANNDLNQPVIYEYWLDGTEATNWNSVKISGSYTWEGGRGFLQRYQETYGEENFRVGVLKMDR